MRSLIALSLVALTLAGPTSAEAREPRLGAVLSVPVLNHGRVALGVTPRGHADLRWNVQQGPLSGSLGVQRPSRLFPDRRLRARSSVGLHLGGGTSVFVTR